MEYQHQERAAFAKFMKACVDPPQPSEAERYLALLQRAWEEAALTPSWYFNAAHEYGHYKFGSAGRQHVMAADAHGIAGPRR
jgi:hypothetical protein